MRNWRFFASLRMTKNAVTLSMAKGLLEIIRFTQNDKNAVTLSMAKGLLEILRFAQNDKKCCHPE